MRYNPIGAITPGPWRLLVLCREPDDPKYLIATVESAADVMPADLDAAGRYQDWPAVLAWIETRTGGPHSLVPVHDPLCWRVDPPARPRFQVIHSQRVDFGIRVGLPGAVLTDA